MTRVSSRFDIAVVGAGVLGVFTAFWISELYACSIAIVDKEETVAQHASSRNTGVIHRPFYLNPEKKRMFAKSAQKSYPMWMKLAATYGLPWKQVETLEVALNEADVPVLERYMEWGLRNGMLEAELSLLDGAAVKKLEPRVECVGAIRSKTDTAVNYKSFTDCVYRIAAENGVKLLGGMAVGKATEKGGHIELELRDKEGRSSQVNCGLLINAAGGGALDLAHHLGLAQKYTDLHFRGDYWVVEEPFASSVRRNVYSVPKHKEFPFLDPHFIVRFDGTREIGPNAALVFSPTAYNGLSETKSQLIKKIFERPLTPKIRLSTNTKFLSLIWTEWMNTLSKKAMCQKVSRFIPTLKPTMLRKQGLAGIRSPLIDRDGFVPEAIIIEGPQSVHLLNYNSPGATGAPAFSAHIVSRLHEKGRFEGLPTRRNRRHSRLWNFEKTSDL